MASASEGTPLLGGSDEWKPTTRLRFLQSVTWINVFLTGFDSTVAASLYARIASDFGQANNAVWVSTSYLVTAVSFQALYGRLSDIYGRRAAFLFGTIVFSLGSLLCGLSTSMTTLFVSRAIAGLGGGGLMTMATVVLSDKVPFERRGLYQAANNLMYGLGSASGASLGGVLAYSVGWRAVFLLQVPLSLAAVIGGYVLVENVTPLPPGDSLDQAQPPPPPPKVDGLGAATLVLAVSTLLLGLSMGGNEIAWSSPASVAILLSALGLFALFFRVESRAPAPILPTRMLTGRMALSNVATNFFSGMAVYSFLFMVPLFFVGARLEALDVVGARLFLPALGFPIGAFVAGYVMSTYGKLNLLVRTGCLVLVLGSILPLSFPVDGHPSELYYFFHLIPVQIGQGLINPSSLFTLIAAFPHADQAVATSTVYLTRNLGNVAGVALSSAILQNYLVVKLPVLLKHVPNKAEIIERIRHSTDAIRDLPLDVRTPVQHAYADGIRLALVVSTGLAVVALAASFWARGVGLQRPSPS
ncbi:MFS general substrate transporter [Acaromyces ingoldii]|uniref:MFS general substrate transporter n=1 Tax=Acaromyces ingoldii TaxID=215250 RepID=A0A316YI50_9BASI|nr:MFS general substrate transporter [Acaromyces ingoldii]PWN88869.1 MFS general substrate transporter [Acaromyces ingoldii]